MTRDPASGDHVVRLAASDQTRFGWWTIRARIGDDAWRTWVLPSTQRQVVVAGAADSRPVRAVVSVVDRLGNESSAQELEKRLAP